MIYIWNYLKKNPIWLVLDFIGALLFVFVNLGLPTVLSFIIDRGIVGQDKGKFYFWILVMLGVVILGSLGRVLLTYTASRLTSSMIRDIRLDIYDKLQGYSHQEFNHIGVSSLVTRVTNDAFVLMQFAETSLRLGIITPLMMIFSVILILMTSPSLAWLVAISVPFLAVVIAYVAIKTAPLSEQQQKLLDRINQIIRESLTGIRVIRAFNREDFQEKRFDKENETYSITSQRLFTLTGLTEPLFIQIIIAMIVAIVWFALNPLESGQLKIGTLVAFIEYSFHVLYFFQTPSLDSSVNCLPCQREKINV